VQRFHTESEEQTVALGERLAPEIRRPCVVLLIGNLGAGKTTLVKGIVKGLGVAAPEEVTSPTFTLIHEYGGGVYHVDLYRLETAREVASLGLDEIFDREDAIVLIEWGERFPELMPAERMEIRIEGRDDTREISSSLLCPGTTR
jgi:tRNA threonylcarbamoyladenosine biosynthesis protein TsaE